VGTEGAQRPDDQVPELKSGTRVHPAPERIAHPDDQTSEADHHAAELSPGPEGVESLDQVAPEVSTGGGYPISATDRGAAQPNSSCRKRSELGSSDFRERLQRTAGQSECRERQEHRRSDFRDRPPWRTAAEHRAGRDPVRMGSIILVQEW
jgi:hypothetical protein